MSIRKGLLVMILLAWIPVFSLSVVKGAQTSSTPITIDNAAQVQEAAQLKGHTGPVFSLAFSLDGHSLVSGGSGSDYNAILWDVTTASQKALLTGHTAQIAAVGFNADGSRVLTASYDGSIRTWDSSSGASQETIDKNDSDLPFGIDNLLTFFSADGSKLIYTGGAGLYVVDVASHAEVDANGSLDYIPNVEGIAISPDASKVAWMDDAAKIHLLDGATLVESSTLTPTETTEYGGTLAFSQDGKMLAASNYDTSSIQLWNLETQEAGPLLTGHQKNDDGSVTVNSVAFNADGTLLVSASYDNTIRIWDVSTGTELVSLNADQPTVVAFSPDGSVLASAGIDGIVHLWSVPAR
jgi:WD40 repeat protein